MSTIKEYTHPRIIMRDCNQLQPYKDNARTHSDEQIKQIARSIERFGFTNPVLIADDGGIIAGHGRVRAAELLGIKEVPTIKLAHLSIDERRAYIIADNKLALNASWDPDILAIELQALIDLDFDVDLTGFASDEIDILLDCVISGEEDKADKIPVIDKTSSVTEMGDLWLLGRHRLLCGDARSSDDIVRLVDGDKVDLIFTDPPYNVAIKGHVSGLGKHQHSEFAFASGEMDKLSFIEFLTNTLSNAAVPLRDGGIAFICMDWRHMEELLKVGNKIFSEMKNLCVWNKSNGGMGSFYRSKHELIFVFKKGKAAHINNFGLGEKGRYRTNVWDYAGVNSFGKARDQELAMHPTVKPVALVMDAIKDCTKQLDTVLDVFAGSGTTMIAAHNCNRKSLLLEYDTHYCDVIIKRFEEFTSQKAIHQKSGYTFTETQRLRFKEVV